jgi:hypothetical protein
MSLQSVDGGPSGLASMLLLLLIPPTQDIPPAAAEAAEAEGVPARLRAVALSGAAFGGPGDENGGCARVHVMLSSGNNPNLVLQHALHGPNLMLHQHVSYPLS